MHDDVIVIGAGLAGMMAADTARAEGARVLLLNRGGIGLGPIPRCQTGSLPVPATPMNWMPI